MKADHNSMSLTTKLYDQGVRLLARREFSRSELSDRLATYLQRQLKPSRNRKPKHKKKSTADHQPSWPINENDLDDQSAENALDHEPEKATTMIETMIESILDQLESVGYLNDQRFCEQFIENRFAQGKGPLKIEAELKHKGISASLRQQFLDPNDPRWAELASQIDQRHQNKSRNLAAIGEASESPISSDPYEQQTIALNISEEDWQITGSHQQNRYTIKQKNRQKRIRFLQQRGFSFEQIRFAITSTDSE